MSALPPDAHLRVGLHTCLAGSIAGLSLFIREQDKTIRQKWSVSSAVVALCVGSCTQRSSARQVGQNKSQFRNRGPLGQGWLQAKCESKASVVDINPEKPAATGRSDHRNGRTVRFQVDTARIHALRLDTSNIFGPAGPIWAWARNFWV